MNREGFRFDKRSLMYADSFEFVAENSDSIIEALISIDHQSGCVADEISFRFVVCNPETIIDAFVGKVFAIAGNIGAFVRDDSGVHYKQNNERDRDNFESVLRGQYADRRQILQQRFGLSEYRKSSNNDFYRYLKGIRLRGQLQ